MKADVYNLKNEVVGTVELPSAVFGTKWNAELVTQVLDAQLANARLLDRSGPSSLKCGESGGVCRHREE